MRLTAHTDYALRILLHAALAARDGDGLLGVAQVAADHAISRNNAMKVVNVLSNAGLLQTVRGRSGGFRLGRSAETITLGEVVRLTEPCLNLADCENCILRGSCGLRGMLNKAMGVFLAELDQQTLAQAAAGSRLPAAIQLSNVPRASTTLVYN
ncbi:MULTISPECIES: Rrf2 family transcriptional regulator [Sphingomonadaceae]|jgi:Rrf2 family nitric oxide-sensitive transcriptional repressor|uniref:Rrf2 family transcriptional regulator n=2 Tax=Sphingomonadaceae TaxID=41297 RepID=A0A418YN78_9SPHN|nr:MULTISPECIES: Rrf2 family transcriptional regulator [Sphingobium]OHD06084.1 MAG: Rrf2 family transcriptional regulator [Sphingomonadales bacterium GWF1_63_6]RJG52528.1 Rrf2 family transcriptional regulator [Sphingobium terrigena]|tara:strand:+ start:2986 stop:3447 length:462 start_codon:yes stop_codon:yes gene_type:complete